MSQIPVSFLATAQSRSMLQKSGERSPVPCLNRSVFFRALRIRNSFDRGDEMMDDLRFTCGLLLLALDDQFDGAEVGDGRHMKTSKPGFS